MYPKNKNLIDSDSTEAHENIDIINTLGIGIGGQLGEAMLDGIYEAATMNFRESARPVFIVYADDCHHGIEFHGELLYPRGCLCGIDWKKLLKKIEEKN